MKLKKINGFTLIELLVVIALLGVMSILVIPSFNGSLRKSRDSKRKSDLRQIAKALEVYYNDTGSYPTSNRDGKIVVGNTAVDWGSPFANGAVMYMTKLPKDSGSRSYRYEAVLTGTIPTGYYLMAQLENTSDPEYYPVDGSTYSCGSGACSFVATSANVTPPATIAPTTAPTNTPPPGGGGHSNEEPTAAEM